jgi:hypothetical protein
LVKEALGVAYITLWGRYTARSLEAAIHRAAGIAAVLGEELNAPIPVVLAGILHEVIATLNLTSQLRTETGFPENGMGKTSSFINYRWEPLKLIKFRVYNIYIHK